MYIVLKVTNFLGPKLPRMCGIATMVTISDGQETFLVGCNDEDFNIAQIYKLVWQEDCLEWIKYQTLKYPKTRFVAMTIPNDAVNFCSECTTIPITTSSTISTTTTTTTESKSGNVFSHYSQICILVTAAISTYYFIKCHKHSNK